MSSKLKKAAGKKEKGKKAGGGTGGNTRHLMPHEILEAMGSPRDAAKGGTRPRAATAGMVAAVKLSKQRSAEAGGGGGTGGGGVGGGGMGGGMAGLGGMLPAMSALGYGPRVVSKTLPIDPNDTSSFSINIPQVYLYYTNTLTASLHAHAHGHGHVHAHVAHVLEYMCMHMHLPLYVLEPRSTPPHTLTAGCQGHHQASSRGVQADQRPGWWGAGSARQASH